MRALTLGAAALVIAGACSSPRTVEVTPQPAAPAPAAAPAPLIDTIPPTLASPSALTTSASSRSSCASRADGPRAAPASSALKPPCTNCSRHFAIEVSEHLLRRAASATVASPRSTLSTIRCFS